MRGESFAPIVVPAQVWNQDVVQVALRERDVATLLTLVQRHTGASQQRLATALDISQGRVNELINRKRMVSALGTFERLADGLNMPDHARMSLGLAPAAYVRMALDNLSEIGWTYPSQAEAANEIRTRASGSDAIDVMAVRGLGLLGLNDSLLRDALPAEASIRVLLLNPDSESAARRAEEIGESVESFAAGIRLAIARIKELSMSGSRIELYSYDHVPVWRIIKVDDVLFVSAFTSVHEGHTSPTHRIEPNHRGVLHHAFVRTLKQAVASADRII
ncbi:helix-turn-helix domain-containing protein [Nocardia concava]|uniref:helix-turn-helix domain-containing protein n=1 Tax=Nocardia concava TaxID=257281 RepID=UPI000592EE54|nr:helix-turn-helix transcriptional regulator [Nocardia concava]